MIELIFPPSCLLCDRPLRRARDPRLCVPCLDRITPINAPHCSRCLIPFHTLRPEQHRCSACMRRGHFGRLFALGRYEGGLADLLKQLKFKRRLAVAPALAHLLQNIEDLIPALPCYDSLIPVPLHRSMLRRRGFNQSALIGARFARDKGLRLDRRGLQKRRKTATQSGLKARQRSDNVRGVFVATRSFHGESCLLIDDIFTTGATAESCSAALYAAGAMIVDVLTVARAV